MKRIIAFICITLSLLSTSLAADRVDFYGSWIDEDLEVKLTINNDTICLGDINDKGVYHTYYTIGDTLIIHDTVLEYKEYKWVLNGNMRSENNLYIKCLDNNNYECFEWYLKRIN